MEVNYFLQELTATEKKSIKTIEFLPPSVYPFNLLGQTNTLINIMQYMFSALSNAIQSHKIIIIMIIKRAQIFKHVKRFTHFVVHILNTVHIALTADMFTFETDNG